MAKTILVADDNPGHVSLLESALRSRGYLVLTASDGRSALELARSRKPDLIILDVAMPEMDGDLVAMHLKANDSPLKDTPILIVTALRTEKEIIENKEENVFAKPVKMDQLLHKVEELIRI